MNSLWIVSSVLQWMVIAALCVIVLSLLRQLGVVFVRLNPSAGFSGTDDGAGPGTEVSAQEMELFPQGSFVVGGQRTRPLLVTFLSPDCSMCTTVAGYVRAIARDYADDLDLLVVVHGTPRIVREFVETYGLKDLPVGLRQNYPSGAWPPSSTPFGVAINAEGTVSARGTPNALEHLEEMIRAAEAGLPLEVGSKPAEYVWGSSLPVDSKTSSNGHPVPAVTLQGGLTDDRRN